MTDKSRKSTEQIAYKPESMVSTGNWETGRKQKGTLLLSGKFRKYIGKRNYIFVCCRNLTFAWTHAKFIECTFH